MGHVIIDKSSQVITILQLLFILNISFDKHRRLRISYQGEETSNLMKN